LETAATISRLPWGGDGQFSASFQHGQPAADFQGTFRFKIAGFREPA
jgi:hypothetical protein